MAASPTPDVTSPAPTAAIDWWHPIVGAVPRGTARQLADLGTTSVVEPGQLVVETGDRADHFFVVESGTVEVRVGPDVRIELGSGEFFGEIALFAEHLGAGLDLDQVLRSADVVATTKATLRVLDRAQFAWLLDVVPAAAPKIARQAITRLALNLDALS